MASRRKALRLDCPIAGCATRLRFPRNARWNTLRDNVLRHLRDVHPELNGRDASLFADRFARSVRASA